MAMTREKRSTYPLCGARKRNGELCRLFAGQNTQHKGVGRCYLHGGRTPNHIKNAAKVEAQRRLVGFGEPVDITPETAMLMMLRISAGQVAWLKEELTLGGSSGFDKQVLVAQWDAERDRLTRIAKAALDAGIAERQVRIAESYGEQLADLLRGVLFSAELALTADQRAVLPELLRTHLTALERRHAELDPARAV